ncbi:hypothetical protein SO802_018452 [Lithocarpus litseifolius]|uniref:Uncharacterized protein n=1 Tax=Lithocarpus litseifolius TaxID=425828 RepID=A0AAW2CNR1_9ROSI
MTFRLREHRTDRSSRAGRVSVSDDDAERRRARPIRSDVTRNDELRCSAVTDPISKEQAMTDPISRLRLASVRLRLNCSSGVALRD